MHEGRPRKFADFRDRGRRKRDTTADAEAGETLDTCLTYVVAVAPLMRLLYYFFGAGRVGSFGAFVDACGPTGEPMRTLAALAGSLEAWAPVDCRGRPCGCRCPPLCLCVWVARCDGVSACLCVSASWRSRGRFPVCALASLVSSTRCG